MISYLQFTLLQIPSSSNYMLIEGQYSTRPTHDIGTIHSISISTNEAKSLIAALLRARKKEYAQVDIRNSSDYNQKNVKIWSS